MKRTIKRVTALALLYFLVFAVSICWATMSIEVNPNQINVAGVPLGRKIAVTDCTGKRIYLEIKNKNNAAYYYVISILHTPQTTYTLREGFVDIPDTNWIIPEEKEVKVEAHQTKEVELYINIPNKLGYADKKYQAVIEVKNKKNHPQDVFILACQVMINLQTAKKESWLWRWLEWIKKNIW
jgi:hypothetical protein